MTVNFEDFIETTHRFTGRTLRVLYLDHASAKISLSWRVLSNRFQLYTIASLRSVRCHPSLNECIQYQIAPRSIVFTFDNRLRLSLPAPSITGYTERRSALHITLKDDRVMVMVPETKRT